MKSQLSKFYNDQIYYNFHSKNLNVENSKNKAFWKTGLLAGIYVFFIYAFLVNMINQLFFDFPNTRLIGLIVVTPFILISIIWIKYYLPDYLYFEENCKNFNSDKLKSVKNYNIKIAIITGTYATLMFILIRLSNTHISFE